MTQEKIAEYFDALTVSANELAQDADMSMTDALIEVLENIYRGDVQHELGKPTPEVTAHIQNMIANFNWHEMPRTDLRKTLQLAILKASRDDKVSANHQLTPDGIGYLLADFISQTADLTDGDTIIDLTVGTGNLLNTVNDVLLMNDVKVKQIGIDNDDMQLALASATDALLNSGATELFQEDVVSLKDVPKAKVVIADLPVGYYPLDPGNTYDTRVSEGRSFVHHLLIEKSLDFLTDEGWAYLIVPANVLTGDNAKSLLKFVAKKAQLKAFLQLPTEFFKDQRAAKAILVLRKNGIGSKSEVLMGQYPTLKNIDALKSFLQDIQDWVKLDKEQDEA